MSEAEQVDNNPMYLKYISHSDVKGNPQNFLSSKRKPNSHVAEFSGWEETWTSDYVSRGDEDVG